MKDKPIRALYFATKDRKLRYGDGRSINVGSTHTVDCKPKCCNRGLHASVKVLDALWHAPGSILYLVELSGDMDIGTDKMAATKRKYIAEFDATELLRKFARKQALINIEKIKPYITPKQYNLIVEYLETGKEELREEAYSVASSTARSALSALSIVTGKLSQ